MTRNEIVQKIIELKAVAVVRMEDPSKLIKVAEAIYDGGVKAIEITMTVPNAIEMISLATKEIGNKVLIGVGSMKSHIRIIFQQCPVHLAQPKFKQPMKQEPILLNYSLLMSWEWHL